jgi:capsular polysaccharide biosynthesis protein
MDFLDALRVLWRRWYVVLLGIFVVGLGCGAVITQVKTEYQASAQYLLLLPSNATGEKTPQNPITNQPAGLVIGASLIAADLSTKDAARSLESAGFKSTYAIALNPQSGPLLSITVTDTDGSAAVAMRDELLRRLDQRLDAMQQRDIPGIPANQVIFSLKAAVNQEAEVVPGAKIKALVVVVAAGGLATLILTFLLDRVLLNRAETRAASPEKEEKERRRKPSVAAGDSAHADLRP